MTQHIQWYTSSPNNLEKSTKMKQTCNIFDTIFSFGHQDTKRKEERKLKPFHFPLSHYQETGENLTELSLKQLFLTEFS